jgi:mono/diheme cytochrome c family protein
VTGRTRIPVAPFLAAIVATVLMPGCSGGGGDLSESADHGRKIYQNVCIACHNNDPNLDGSIGPANSGASLALLEAKVIHGQYPPGYKPKRETHAMPTFPYLKKDLPDLVAYLAEVQKPGS